MISLRKADINRLCQCSSEGDVEGTSFMRTLIAIIVVHEIAHAIAFADGHRGTEAFYQNHIFSEPGLAAETALLGGLVEFPRYSVPSTHPCPNGNQFMKSEAQAFCFVQWPYATRVYEYKAGNRFRFAGRWVTVPYDVFRLVDRKWRMNLFTTSFWANLPDTSQDSIRPPLSKPWLWKGEKKPDGDESEGLIRRTVCHLNDADLPDQCRKMLESILRGQMV